MTAGPYTRPPDPAVQCPRCSGPLVRVPRRLLDRLLGLFSPRRRYRCRQMACGWEGTLRRRQ